MHPDAGLHSAPAVSYPVGRSRFHGWLLALTVLAGVLTGWLWQRQGQPDAWRLGLFATLLAGVSLLAVLAWRRSPRGNLRWDGQVWCWTSADSASCGVLSVHLDLQFCLLLCLRSEVGARIWLWPERGAELALWSALRRAAFAHDGVQATDSANTDSYHPQVYS